MNKFKILENMIRTEVKKQLNEQTFNYTSYVKKLGINVASIPKYQQEPVTIKVIDIDPSTLGMLSAVFAKVTLEVEGQRVDRNGKEVIIIYLDYRYKYYNTGSNGHDIRLISEDDGKTWVRP